MSNIFGGNFFGPKAGAGTGAGNGAAGASTAAPASAPLFANLNVNNNNASSGRPNLFATPPATTAPASGGVFGSAATGAPPAGGVFGGAAAPAAGGGNLFGPAVASESRGGNLFGPAAPSAGGNPFSKPQAPPLGNPFSQAMGANNAQPQAQQNPQASQPAQPLNQSQTPAGHAYFQSLLEKHKKRAREAEKGPQLGEVPGLNIGLDDISKRVRDLGGAGAERKMDGAGDTRAHYLLAASGVNPGRTIRDLEALNGMQPPAAAAAAEEWDPDTHKYVEQLHQRMTDKMIAEGLARSKRDFDNFVQEHIDMDWEAQRRKIYEHFGLNPKASARTFGRESVERGGFGRSSRRERDLNGDGSRRAPMNRSIYNQSSLNKSVIGSPSIYGGKVQAFGDSMDQEEPLVPADDDRFKREKQTKFAEKVRDLNEARLAEVNYPVLGEFASVEGALRGDSAQHLIETYKALIEIAGENAGAGVKPRAFVKGYLDDEPNSQAGLEMRKQIIEGARTALEKQFYDNLCSQVDRNARDARVGGTPTRIQRVRAYIRVRESRRNLAPDGVELRRLENGDYCWALVFFLLRCGFVKEAAEYVASRDSAFSTVDRTFATYITNYERSPDRRLSQGNQTKINNEYMQRQRAGPEGSLDPYRMACVKIIGRCELQKRSLDGIGGGVEDWAWLQFVLAREGNRADEMQSERFGLENVQGTIQEIGSKYFTKGSEHSSGYGTYFYLQILAGLFEDAVNYLYEYSYVSAVHFAIALSYYGLLRVSDFSASEEELLSKTTTELSQINFSRMIGYYTADFRAANVTAATDYLVLICLNADLPGELGRNQGDVCREALRELVLETREFAQLLGDLLASGDRVPGALEKRVKLISLPQDADYLRALTIQAASVADTNSRTTDAILLYHLAEDYNNVLVVINQAMSDALTVDPGNDPQPLQPLRPRGADRNRDGASRDEAPGSSLSLAGVNDPFVLSKHFSHLYFKNAVYSQRIDLKTRDINISLMKLDQARGAFRNRRWASVFYELNGTELLPLKASGSIPVIRGCASKISAASPLIARLVGPMLYWALVAISERRADLMGPAEQFVTGTETQLLSDLAQLAKDLMVFAGMMKLRMQKSYWEEIVRVATESGVAA